MSERSVIDITVDPDSTDLPPTLDLAGLDVAVAGFPFPPSPPPSPPPPPPPPSPPPPPPSPPPNPPVDIREVGPSLAAFIFAPALIFVWFSFGVYYMRRAVKLFETRESDDIESEIAKVQALEKEEAERAKMEEEENRDGVVQRLSLDDPQLAPTPPPRTPSPLFGNNTSNAVAPSLYEEFNEEVQDEASAEEEKGVAPSWHFNPHASAEDARFPVPFHLFKIKRKMMEMLAERKARQGDAESDAMDDASKKKNAIDALKTGKFSRASKKILMSQKTFKLSGSSARVAAFRAETTADVEAGRRCVLAARQRPSRFLLSQPAAPA